MSLCLQPIDTLRCDFTGFEVTAVTRNFVTTVSMCGKTIIIMLIPFIDCMLIVVYMHDHKLAQAFSLALVLHKKCIASSAL